MASSSSRLERRSSWNVVLLGLGATLASLLLLEAAGRVLERVDPREPGRFDTSAPSRVAPASPGTRRIFLYGGSTVEGAPLREYSFVEQLRFWLGRMPPDRDVELVNFGKNGVGSDVVLQDVRRTIDQRPDTIVVLTAHNEFLSRGPEPGAERLRWRVRDLTDRLAMFRVGRRLLAAISAQLDLPPPLLLPHPVEPVTAERRAEVLAAFERNLLEITALAADRGIPLVLATGPANLADWPPVHRFLHDEAYERGIAALREHIAGDAREQAEMLLAELSRRYAPDAMLTFLGGRLARARGDVAAARRAFDDARDADPMPWRVTGPENDAIRRVAARPGVQLVDFDAALRDRAPMGLVGFDLIADNCHPTPLGSALMVRALLEGMVPAGLLDADPGALPPPDEQAALYLRELSRGQPDLELEYLLNLARYVMKVPFYNFEASTAYLERARVLAPEDWRVWANLGTLSILEGRLEEGRAQLARAQQSRGKALERGDRRRTPYLREAMALASGELERFAPAETH